MTENTITTTEVVVRCDLGDGNDPTEATTRLPIVPRVGDSLEVWIDEGRGNFGSRPEFLDIKTVSFCTYAPERIELWVSTDGHSDDDIARIFQAIKDNDQP